MNIKKIRLHYRQLRRQLSVDQQHIHARLISKNLQDFFAFTSHLKIAAYSAVQGEISLNYWISENKRQQIYLPKLYETVQPQLRFAVLDKNTLWKKNRFNILEPDAHWGNCLHPRHLNCILVPLVAFDRTGTRLGMGGGYYDRSLAFRHSRKKWLNPQLIGIAHSCQEHTRLPRQDWDVPLDFIITENELITPDV